MRAPAQSSKVEALLALEAAGSLHHRVELSCAEARIFAKLCDPHGEGSGLLNNEFVDLIDTINGIIPPMHYGDDNSNNGKPHHRISIGKEFSRVLYLDIVYSYFAGNPLGNEPNHKQMSVVMDLVTRLEQIARSFEAQEVSKEMRSLSFTIRMWWD